MKRISRKPILGAILGLLVALCLFPVCLAAQTGNDLESAKSESSFEPQSFTLTQMNALPAAKVEDRTYAEASPAFMPQLPPMDIIGGGSFGNSFFKSTLALNLALNAADFFTTREALSHQDVAEANPFMKGLVKSPLLFAGVKLGVSAISIFLLDRIYQKNKTLGWIMTTITNSVMGYVVANNMRVIAAHK